MFAQYSLLDSSPVHIQAISQYPINDEALKAHDMAQIEIPDNINMSKFKIDTIKNQLVLITI